MAAAPNKLDTVFFTHTLCPYAERVWIALLETGTQHLLVHIDLSRKPGWYRSVNPRGLVPALQHDGRVQLESADICRQLDSLASEPDLRLSPPEPALQREMEELLRGPCRGVVAAGLDLMAGSMGRHWGIGSGQTAAQREGFEAHLRGLSASLQRHGGPFLLGTHLTLADVMVYPFLYRFSVAKKFSGYDIGAVLGGRTGEWLAALEARPAFRTTSADSRLLLEAFTAHQSLDFFDYETYTCFQLHPHNQHMLT